MLFVGHKHIHNYFTFWQIGGEFVQTYGFLYNLQGLGLGVNLHAYFFLKILHFNMNQIVQLVK